MSKLELLALSNMVNSSEAMFDRRRRILREARKMISSGGLDEFNMRDLGKRADVSTRTIYNAFGSKETVIALSIHAYFEKFMAHIRFSDDAWSFEGALARQVTSTLRDVDIPHYMKAVTTLYFSPTLHPDIRTVLLDLASRPWVAWLGGLQALRQLEKHVDIADLMIDLSNLQYAKLQEWCLGTLDDDAFLQKTLSGILLMLAGATSGKARTNVREAFVNIQSDTPFRTRLLAEARARITEMEREAAESRARKSRDA